jgi:hypothetical protein
VLLHKVSLEYNFFLFTRFLAAGKNPVCHPNRSPAVSGKAYEKIRDKYSRRFLPA